MGAGDSAQEVLDGVLIRRYPPPPDTRGHRDLPVRVRVLLAANGAPRAARAPRRGLRRHPGVQPAGHVLGARAAVQARRQEVRLRPARPLPRGVRVAISERLARPAPRPPPPRAGHVRRRRPRDLDERLVSSDRHPTRERRERGRHRRSDGTGSRAPSARCTEPRLATRPQVPVRLPRRHGPAGRRRSRTPRRRRARACRPRRHPVRLHGQGRQHRRARRARGASSASRTSSRSPAGSRTRSCPRCSRPPTSGFPRIRSTP